jgi:hypothetical protein
MSILTIELPDDLATELNDRQVSDEFIHVLVVQTIQAWLRKSSQESLQHESENSRASIFDKSAIDFVERLLDENRTLFERLADL